MIRNCNGNPGSGLNTAGGYCTCLLTFDDFDREPMYPHAILPSLNVISAGTSLTFPAPSVAFPAGSAFWPGVTIGTTSTASWTPVPSYVYPPNAATLSMSDLSRLAMAYATLVTPGEKIVICVDSDVVSEQIRELGSALAAQKIEAVIVRGARAGTGCGVSAGLATPQDERLDVLARIAGLWEQRPDIGLSDLLAWYKGEALADADFAAAAEIYFQKVFGGTHGQSR